MKSLRQTINSEFYSLTNISSLIPYVENHMTYNKFFSKLYSLPNQIYFRFADYETGHEEQNEAP